ncbi:ThuA domain-containing protein [Maribacter sp. 2307ULW6-5]|uniref:ThuA domain-containing protein n=1 Tax=Maribacter sp. 2307ULW6-5 TaxID=3386275 RepID=UPI0039BD5263
MKFLSPIFFLLSLFLVLSCGQKREGAPKVLVFSKTLGFKHASIPAGISAIKALGPENGFEVDTTKNAALFTEKNLEQYAAVIFLSTTGNVLDHHQEAAFERYIQSGGGFVGIHAAADTEYDWGWYNKLVGAQFLSHPPGTPEANFIITNSNFAATSFFKDTVWTRSDELYNYKNINPDVNVIMTVDEDTYEGGANGAFHPISWYHEYDGGRAFYTGGGHTDASFSEPLFLKHLLGGIQYAMGKNERLDYAKATSQIPPETDRFSKVTLHEGAFFEPTEMTILPNHDVLVAQRRGEVMRYNAATGELTEVAKLDVYHKTLNTPNVNAEEGLMGLQKDPDYANNHWIYLFYAPTGDAWVNRLSRFKYKDGNFDLGSEQVILEVDSQREICCHTGGSIAFGPKGYLYLSTGDNTTPFNEPNAKYVHHGFGPLNDLPGREQYDARRSSANTNDLRGKILRIQVNEDGSYDIPEGNLFPVGTEKTRPEIYTMGHRNPYRISVDAKKGYVYWGDVGPDARADSLGVRGPRGYDEMNQAREAGNFGWPMFIGDNYPYNAYNYETGESGPEFDPELPINDSRNNTGLRELPPAQPAYAYYPYAETGAFPQLDTGGRNAMAGPTYYSDMYPGKETLPSYYDGKVFIYDWMRGWMFAVHLFEDGTFNKMEPFAPEIELNNLIDMEVGPDGRVYLLEYGSGWFTQNANSALGYVAYNGGNRPPLISGLHVDETSGTLPLKIRAKVAARDREDDTMSYLWDFGNGDTLRTDQPEVAYTYTEKGAYNLQVSVNDGRGQTASSERMGIVAGNSRPKVTIEVTKGNKAFYLPGKSLDYAVSVNDPDGQDTVDETSIYVSVDYLEGMDKVAMNLGHQQVSAAVTGKALTQSMDCKTCHKELGPSIGPSYMEISEKYKERRDAITYLQGKIVQGGSGVWGEVMMPAHPKVTSDESRQIALYIKSLASEEEEVPSLPAKGTITAAPSAPGTVMVISASYTDAGSEGVLPLTGSQSLVIPSNVVSFAPGMENDGLRELVFNGMDIYLAAGAKGWLQLPKMDYSGVSSLTLAVGWQQAPEATYTFQVRRNAPDGEVVAQGTLMVPKGQPGGAAMMPLQQRLKEDDVLYLSYGVNNGKPSAIGLVNVTLH